MTQISLKATYDPEADAVYISFKDDIQAGEVVNTFTVDNPDIENDVNLDFATDRRLLGMEILYASKCLPAPLLKQFNSK